MKWAYIFGKNKFHKLSRVKRKGVPIYVQGGVIYVAVQYSYLIKVIEYEIYIQDFQLQRLMFPTNLYIYWIKSSKS